MSTSKTVKSTRLVQGVEVPAFFYGTAWKEDATAGLVVKAIEAGFRGIDTANQRKHYYEAGVGQAIQRCLESGDIDRDQLFLQSKFTYQRGQDHRLPFNPKAPLTQQVLQSFESSLEHLGVQQLDSLVLHGPSSGAGWTDADREVWGTMEELQASGQVRLLGVSNVSARHLLTLCDEADGTPAFVQNRCFADAGWDAEVREICADEGMVYQGFSLLTANRRYLQGPQLEALARKYDCTVPQLVFRFSMEVGMIPLTGTTDVNHMAEDLAVHDLLLAPKDVDAIETVAQR